MKKTTFIIIALLVFNNLWSQVIVTIDDVYVQSQFSVNNCNNIDLGTVQSSNLVFSRTVLKNK